MRISHTANVEGGRVLYPIGKISAVTAWSGLPASVHHARAAALRELIRAAEDADADAVIEVDYHVDGVASCDLPGVGLQRVSAVGIAVKLALS